MKTWNLVKSLTLPALAVLLLSGCLHSGSDSSPDNTITIQYVSATETQLNLRGQGGAEVTRLQFLVMRGPNQPAVGASVELSLTTTVGGIELTSNGSSDSTGTVTATVRAGTVPTSFRVIARHSSGIETSSDAIDISSGVAYNNSISISADPSWAEKKTLDTNGVEIGISIYAADELGNPVIDGMRFTFLTPEWGIFNEATCITEGGRCEATWVSAAFPAKLVGDYASIFAYTDGAESFVDTNGNHVFDDGESWVDLGELFVDTNESGTWETGEPFIDSDGDGIFDPNGNGVWDGPCPEGPEYTCGQGNASVPIGIEGWMSLCTTEPDPDDPMTDPACIKD